jgi:hypothetical protein
VTPPLLTPEQQKDCDNLLGFAIHCASYKRACKVGAEPLTFEAFAEAVKERMPDKTDQEKLYLLTYGAQYLKIQ